MWQKIFERLRAPRLKGKGNGFYDWNIVGEASFQHNLVAIVAEGHPKGVRIPTIAQLRLEPNNQHDSSAIAVFIEGKQVGYISKSRSSWIAKQMPNGTAKVGALIVGGFLLEDGSTANYGVKLDIKR